jgi:hypothetical protein
MILGVSKRLSHRGATGSGMRTTTIECGLAGSADQTPEDAASATRMSYTSLAVGRQRQGPPPLRAPFGTSIPILENCSPLPDVPDRTSLFVSFSYATRG